MWNNKHVWKAGNEFGNYLGSVCILRVSYFCNSFRRLTIHDKIPFLRIRNKYNNCLFTKKRGMMKDIVSAPFFSKWKTVHPTCTRKQRNSLIGLGKWTRNKLSVQSLNLWVIILLRGISSVHPISACPWYSS